MPLTTEPPTTIGLLVNTWLVVNTGAFVMTCPVAGSSVSGNGTVIAESVFGAGRAIGCG